MIWAAAILLLTSLIGATLPQDGSQNPLPDPSLQLSPGEQSHVIEKARELALPYIANLPNFIVTETIRRLESQKNSQVWKPRDTLILEVAFSENGENQKLLTINGKSTSKIPDEMNGFTTSGDFGTTLQWIFSPESETQFKWEHWTKLRGRVMQVFSYRIEQAHSKYHLSFDMGPNQKDEGFFAFGGLVYVDRETHQVMRLTRAAEGIPVTWPFTKESGELDYGFGVVDGMQFLLPLHAEALLVSRDGRQSRNVMEFSNYHKFSSGATITAIDPSSVDEE